MLLGTTNELTVIGRNYALTVIGTKGYLTVIGEEAVLVGAGGVCKEQQSVGIAGQGGGPEQARDPELPCTIESR